jgi:Protein of unknown function (DUF3667)
MSTATPVAPAPPATAPAAALQSAAPQPAAQPAPVPGGALAAARCENCGAALSGRYCAACGQRAEPPVHSLWHFMQVAAEDLTHADSRLWRTLAALLFRPGYLTREFLAGRRARYLPPVRLYLVLSVAFFLFAAVTQPKLEVVNFQAEHPGTSGLLVPKAGENTQQREARLCGDARYDGPWAARIAPLVAQTCRKIVEDGGRHLREAFLHNLPRAMFVFLPLLAGIMTLLFWRPRHYYVEHLLLLVHNHAFVFLAVMLAWMLNMLLPPVAPWLRFALGVYFVWYMYRSMRVSYGQGRLLTSSKLIVLGFFYLVFGMFTLVLTSLYSVLTM